MRIRGVLPDQPKQKKITKPLTCNKHLSLLNFCLRLQVLQIGFDPVLGCRRLNAQSLVVPSELTTSELELDELLQRWACVSDLFRSENQRTVHRVPKCLRNVQNYTYFVTKAVTK